MSKQDYSAKPYIIGFLLSLVLTLVPYWLVTDGNFDRTAVLVALAVFAVMQVWIQLYFFLHLNTEPKPRLKSWAFGFMTLVVIIVAFGSIWVMNNLDYHMMSGHDAAQQIQEEEAITPHAH